MRVTSPATAAITVGADGTIEGWNEAVVLEACGDVSNNGRVGIEDAILILKHIVGLAPLDAILRSCGSCSGKRQRRTEYPRCDPHPEVYRGADRRFSCRGVLIAARS